MRQFLTLITLGLAALGLSQVDLKEVETRAKSSDPAIRMSAVESLKGLSDLEAVRLLDGLAWESDRKVADAALAALDVSFRNRDAEKRQVLREKFGSDYTDTYYKYLQDNRYRVRENTGPHFNAVREAIYAEDPKKTASLITSLLGEIGYNDDPPRHDVIMDECVMTSQRQADSAVEVLVTKSPDVARSLIRNPQTRIRASLMGYLSKLRKQEDVPLVKMLFTSPNITLRVSAVRAIEEMFFPELMPLAVQASRDRSIRVRYASVDALRRFVCDDTIEAICALILDEDEQVGFEAIHALEDFDGPRFDPIILSLLESTKQERKHRALAALKLHPVPQAIPTLLRILEKPSNDRPTAIRALAVMNQPVAVEKVCAIALDRKYLDRATACSQLAKLGEKGASIAIQMLGNLEEDENVLLILMGVVEEMRFKAAGSVVNRLRTHLSRDVRSTATETMKALGLPIIDP